MSVALLLPAIAGADGADAARVLESAAGRYFLRELGLGEGSALSAEFETRLAADIERVRAKLASERGTSAFDGGQFEPGESIPLTEAQQASLREAFIEQGREVREFLKLGERPASYGANRDRFLSEQPLPKGKGIIFEAQRPDLLDGRIFRIEILRDNVRLNRFVDRFEQGAIDDLLRRYPRELEAVGVRLIEKLPGSTVIEIPDIDALNARIRLRGYGPQFELPAGADLVPPKTYLEMVARGRIPIAPIGEDARLFTHDLLVHAIAITAFLPAQVSAEFAEEAAELLRAYADPAVQASPEARKFIRDVMTSEVNLFDRQTAQIMVIAEGAKETRGERLAELLKPLRGGKAKAQSLLKGCPTTFSTP